MFLHVLVIVQITQGALAVKGNLAVIVSFNYRGWREELRASSRRSAVSFQLSTKRKRALGTDAHLRSSLYPTAKTVNKSIVCTAAPEKKQQAPQCAKPCWINGALSVSTEAGYFIILFYFFA